MTFGPFGRKPAEPAADEKPAMPAEKAQEAKPQAHHWRKYFGLLTICLAIVLAGRYCGGPRKSRVEERLKQQADEKREELAQKDAEIQAEKNQLAKEMQKWNADHTAQTPGSAADQDANGAPMGQDFRSLTPEQRIAIARRNGAFGNTGSGGYSGASVHSQSDYAATLPRDAGSQNANRHEVVSVSYRNDSAQQADAPQRTADQPSVPPTIPEQPAATPSAVAEQPASESSPSSGGMLGMGRNSRNPEDAQYDLHPEAGKKYRIRRDYAIPCTEELRINGAFPGNVNCIVSIPVYSTEGRHLLIPAGSVASGRAVSVSQSNQSRLFVVFDEIIMPDGYTVDFKSGDGLDQMGQTGLRDKVNNHYLRVFGLSIAVAAIGGIGQIGNYTSVGSLNPMAEYRIGVTQGLGSAGVQLLDKFSNVLPTMVIREGYRTNVMTQWNLWVPDYLMHPDMSGK